MLRIIVEPIVISKLFFDNEIITLIKIPMIHSNPNCRKLRISIIELLKKKKNSYFITSGYKNI